MYEYYKWEYDKYKVLARNSIDEINSAWTIQFVNLNLIWMINNANWNISKVIELVNNYKNSLSFPSSGNYSLDTTSNKQTTSTNYLPTISVLWTSFRITVKYKTTYSNKDYPATLNIENLTTGAVSPWITIKSAEHLRDLVSYYQNQSIVAIILPKLDTLKSIVIKETKI